MPINWKIILQILSLVARALAELPPHFDHRCTAACIQDLIDQIISPVAHVPPPAGDSDNG